MSLAPDDVIRAKVKAELRKRMRGLRKTTPLEACTDRSTKIIARLAPYLEGAKTVALFWPMVERHEVDLRPLDTTLRESGVRVAYPTIDQDTNVMTFRFVDDIASLEEAGKGFAEPPSSAPAATQLDAIIVPALAVDPQGHRIGYGAGYYDATLPRFPGKWLAVAYDWQLVAEIPFGAHDVPVHSVVTDQRAFDVSPSASSA